jgi:hypothetical protein
MTQRCDDEVTTGAGLTGGGMGVWARVLLAGLPHGWGCDARWHLEQ